MLDENRKLIRNRKLNLPWEQDRAFMTPRVLFTTVYRKGSEPYDYIGANTRSWFRFYWPRIQSFGLRFLKQNIPELEILEFPTWDEYQKKLQEGWDVVGLSFYLSETHEAMEMVEAARAAGRRRGLGGKLRRSDDSGAGQVRQDLCGLLGASAGTLFRHARSKI